jgi:hypothetical protein
VLKPAPLSPLPRRLAYRGTTDNRRKKLVNALDSTAITRINPAVTILRFLSAESTTMANSDLDSVHGRGNGRFDTEPINLHAK